MKKLTPIHPGEILLEEFLKPLELTQYRLAKSINVPPRRINEIILEKRGITADTALRLGEFFATSAEFWLNLQTHFDLECERAIYTKSHHHIQSFPTPAHAPIHATHSLSSHR